MQNLIDSVGSLSARERKALAVMLKQKGINLYGIAPIFRREPGEPLLPSYAQQRQWFLWQLDPTSSAYHLPTALHLHGALDLPALQRALTALVARHESLRTRFEEVAGQLQVMLLEPWAPMLEVRESTGEAWQAALAEEVAQPFDLATGPLFRVAVWRLGEQEHGLSLVLHHSIADGVSLQVMVDELVGLYSACREGTGAQPPALTVQYPDYALWQRQWMDAGERERQLAYWAERLRGEPQVLALPADRPRPAQQSFAGATLQVTLGPPALTRLKAFAQGENLTLFMLLLGSFQALLQRYTGQADIRVGVPIANRHRAETEGLIGFFVNTQVLKAEVDDALGARALWRQVRQAALEAQEYQDLPFEQLVEVLQPERSLSHNPLFQVMFNHQVQGQARQLEQAGLRIEAVAWENRNAQFDLTLNTAEHPGGLEAAFTYATDLFDAVTVERLAGHWQQLLQAMVNAPDTPLADLPLLSAIECSQLVEGFNATAVNYPLEQPVHRLIEAQALRTPQAPALAFADQHLSYAELNRRANQLAWALQARGVGPDVIVGVALERSVALVVALLAILKAGGAYLPLDPEYPAERLAYMLKDSGVGLVLSHSAIALPAVERIDLDGFDTSTYRDQNLDVEPTGEHLAYLIYTSGSTGKPKGAGNRHSALTNRLCWMQQAYQLTANDSVLQKTPFSFDVSVWEFFWPLMTGARLVVAAPGAHRDPAQLIEVIQAQQITTLHFVPSMLQVFLQDEQVSRCTSLSRIVCSGEALQVDAQQQVFAKLPKASLYNLYGPTEAAIDVTHWTCRDEGRDSVPIGQPIANLACYVLDAHLEPVPVGVLGELYLGGAGLARGYHRRPALSAERFVASPFTAGQRLYRTGDLARYRTDGVIEYAGRVDHQIKLRGLRIELGEIEARLLEHGNVREAAVLAVDGKQLVGYVVLASEPDGWQGELATHLAAQLPDYMVPAQWLALAAMPLSPNGKLERRALPRPASDALVERFVAPSTAMEQALASLWADLLKREAVGVTDNFFALGGDSIISIQLVSRARAAGIQFTPRDLFQHQTVQALARVAQRGEARQVDQGPVSGITPLLPFQQHFFEQPIPNRQHWNQALLLQPREMLRGEALAVALDALVAHHDALRLVFRDGPEGWQGEHQPAARPNLLWQVEVSDSAALEALCEDAQRSLTLSEGPLLRAVLARLPDGSQRLLLAIHHLVVDGVSWRILLEDLHSAYQAAVAGQPPKLPAKTSAFKAWAERLQAHAQSPAMLDELAAWEAHLRGAPATLPCDRPAGRALVSLADSVRTSLPPAVTRQLLQQAPAAYRTQVNDLLLTALARVICRWSGEPSALLQLEGHGREQLFDDLDLSRTVGWFTSLYPVHLQPADDLSTSIKAVKEQLRSVPGKGLTYGLLRYMAAPDVASQLARWAQPRITFNYLGQFDGQFDEQALLRPATEPAGAEMDAQAPLGNWLSLNGQVYDGTLQIDWTFSREQYDRTTVQALADAYAEELAALVTHCVAPGNAGVTPSDFPLAKLSQAQLDALPIAAAELEDLYPLSPMQQGMLFHSLYEQGSGDYVNQLQVSIDGLDPARFEQAWQQALAAHAALRSAFFWTDSLPTPVQAVQRQAPLPVRVVDGNAAQLHELAEAERSQGFNVQAAPLLRLLLVRLGVDRHWLIFTSHHLLLDGWSTSRLLGEVLQRYAGEAPAAASGQYRDYIAWLQRQNGAAAEAFWKRRLAQLESPTRLAQALPAGPAGASGQAAHSCRLDRAATDRLHAVARRCQVTLNTLVQGAWALLLQRYSGQAAVCFGATVAGRPTDLPGAEEQIGLFINTLPVITEPPLTQALKGWLQALQQDNLAMREHEHTPLYEIQRWAGQGGEPLFDSLLVFENYPVAEALAQAPAGLRFGEVITREQTNYALTLGVNLGECLDLHLAYPCAAFSTQGVQALAAQLCSLLQRFEQHLEQPVATLGLLDSEALGAVLAANAPRPYPFEQAVHQRIAAWAMAAPERTALICNGQTTSRGALEAQANRLANWLVAEGVGPEVRVAVALPRGELQLCALLAVLKAGGAYVPLDTQYPRERLAYLLEDSGSALLLSVASLAEQLPLPLGGRLLALDSLDLATWPAQPPQVTVSADTLAYVIYTSGSTGQPKGVAVAHGPLAMHCQAIGERYEMREADCELHFMSFAFDGAHERWLTALTHGARLLVRDDQLWTAEHTYQAMHEHGVTVVAFPPAYLQQLTEHAERVGNPPPVRIYCFGGDAVPRASYERTRNALRPDAIINGYGPTETVVTPLIWKADRETQCDAPYAPIGSRIGDRSAYVLDAQLNPLPTGAIGELYLGGHGLARGYLDRPGLTAERFVADPFSAGGRLYRTGDLVRLRADGSFEYQGRVDHQVKIRGFRIELGEVEASLLRQPGVREAVAVARATEQGRQLVGYLTPNWPGEDPREAAFAALREQLPAYMVPAALVLLDALPLTPNGKVDRKALPAPDLAERRQAYRAPATPMEAMLLPLWQAVLGQPALGVTDDFFALGGDSIISIQLVSRARAAGIQFTPKDLFQHPTVQALARVAQRGEARQVDQGPVSGITPLLPFQQHFFEQPIPNRQHWNQALLLQPREVLRREALAVALDALVAHHDALRLVFREGPEGWQGEHQPTARPNLLWQVEVSDSAALEALCEDAQRSLTLSEGPLLRAVLARLPDGSQRLLLAIHHLVVDGVSWRILLEDLHSAYQAAVAGQPPKLPAKTSAFKAWAERLQAHAQSPAMLDELAAWEAHLRGAPATLPCDRPAGRALVSLADSVRTSLPPAVTRQLLQQAPAAYRTQVNDLLLTALARVICRWSGEPSALLQLEGHGREQLFDDLDLSRTVGWFTSLYPVHLQPADDLSTSIKAVKEQLRSVPGKGLTHGLLRYMAAPDVASQLARWAQPRITFNYLGQFDGQFDEQALLRPATEPAGAEMDAQAPLGNWLSLNGQVYEGTLQIDWTFSREQYDRTTVQALADAYAEELAALVTHCVAPGNAGVTPSDFPLAKLSQAQLDALPIAAAELEDLYPLSPMQQGMLFHSLSDDGDGLYVNQLRLPVDGLDIPRFIDAWQAACQRHPILRTSFQWHSGEPLQRVHRHAPLAVEVIEQADWPADPAWIDALCEAQLKEGFDLTRLPLQRLRLVTDGGRQQCLVWTSHHILMDGWSSSRLFGEVMQHYGGAPVPSAGARYRDFVGWLLAQDRNAAQAWWRERLAPLEGPCLLAPACWPRPQAGLSGHAARYTHWDAARTGALLHFARARGITPNTLIQAAWLLLLQRYTGQAAVCFGATVAGRPDDLPGAHDMLGLFINTLPVIEAPAQHARVADWLPRLQAHNLDLREQAHVPLAEVQRWSGQGGQALFDSIIVFENYPIDARLQEANDSGPQFGASSNRDVTNVPMDLAVHLGDELSIEFLYLRASFSDEAVDGIRLAFEATLQALLDAPEGYLGNLQRLAPEQCAWLQAHAPAPAPRHRRLSVAALLSERAKAQPDATALNCAGQTLSYRQLLAQAEQLARHLLAHGAGPERRVGVALRRTVELPVALLAVLLSGAAYVPLDLDYPAERLAFMLADADLCLVLAGEELSAKVALPPGLACLAPATLLAQPVPAQALPPPHEGLAYLIYTSGSTGLPKAVAVEHGPLSMHCQAIIELYEMVPGTRELHFMSFAFDGAHERWLSTLLAGGTLVLRDDELWTPERTFRALGEQRIDIACFPPAYLQQLASYAQACAEPPPPVRIYCFGGDAVPEPLLEQVGQALRPQYFTNGYGPTETVVTPMLWKVPLGTPCGAACAPIGRAVGQRALWVLDDALEPLPAGVAGELYIGGYGLARGYHGRPGLTAERFVPDPAGEPGARLYRTGDRVRLRDDGVMDYLGRVDQQVKVRGFRIELGEIEARLRRLPGIAEAAVVARDGTAGKQLVAYVVGGQADSETLREQLREQLPAYMVPAQFVHLERLPLSPNGKLDRKALPAPQATTVDGTAPRTTDEALLAEVWAQVLQLERVGIHDNFFELGGDSILSLQVVSRLRNHPEGGRVIKLRDLMQFPTIAQLCERTLAEPAAPVVAPEPRASAGNFGLVPVQAWFFEQAMVDPHHFNQALMLRARVPLAADALEAALRDLLAHHSSLRLCFFEEGGAWRQAYGALPPQPLLWQAEVADAEALEALAERAQGSLDLANGPLLRAVHAKLPDGEARLLLVIHHLAVDAVSWRVLLEDLRMAYEARCAGNMAQLADTGSAYRAWAEQLAADAPARVERELDYWLRTLGDAPAGFPCDNPRGRDQVRHLAYATLGLDAGATERLLKQAPKAYGAQINDLLLAALARVLCRWTGEASALVQLEGHGREDLFDGLELSRTSGWFTTLYPVRLAPGAGASLRASVTAVREQLATVPDKGVGYGVLRYLAGRPVAERLAALPQARVTFNYLGQFDQAFDEQALLVPASESHGEAYGPQAPLGNWLEIVGQVYDGRLTFRCLYSTRRYRAATVEALVQALEAELQALVEPTALSGLPL